MTPACIKTINPESLARYTTAMMKKSACRIFSGLDNIIHLLLMKISIGALTCFSKVRYGL